jgi:hypothetical protein
MHTFRRHLTYANVTATLALVFAMSGGALAANHYLIHSTKQISPKVLKALRGKAGPKGSTGATGPTGATGAGGKEGAVGKDATIPAIVWQPLALEHGWLEYTAENFGAPSYTKDVEGFVHLSGALNGGSQKDITFATLPVGFRPRTESAWVRAASTNGAGDPHLVDIEIESTGTMAVANGSSATDAFVSLEGVSFYAG